MASTLLFRGLPSTGGIQDYRTRQVIDAVIENLRQARLEVASSGVVFSGTDPSTPADASVLSQLGGGAKWGIDFLNTHLRLKTLGVTAPLTLADANNKITLAIDPEALEGTDAFTVICNASDATATAAALDEKLVNTSITGLVDPVQLLVPNAASKRLEVKALVPGEGIVFTGSATAVEIALDDTVTDDHLVIADTGDANPGTLSAKLDNASIAGLVDPVQLLELNDAGTLLEVKNLVPGVGIILTGGASSITIAGGLVIADAGDETAATLSEKLVNGETAGDGVALVVPDATAHTVKVKRLNAGENITFTDDGDELTLDAAMDLPAGTLGQVLYHDGTAWVASSLTDLVVAILRGIAPVESATINHTFLVKGAAPDLDLGWAPLQQCE